MIDAYIKLTGETQGHRKASEALTLDISTWGESFSAMLSMSHFTIQPLVSTRPLLENCSNGLQTHIIVFLMSV
jgi:hypothetical protein